MKEIKIRGWIARDNLAMPLTTRFHYGKPEFLLQRFGCYKNAARLYRSKDFLAVENCIKKGECKKVEIIIREIK